MAPSARLEELVDDEPILLPWETLGPNITEELPIVTAKVRVVKNSSSTKVKNSSKGPTSVGCDICDKTFPSFIEFRSHIPVVSELKPHLVCRFCRERFGSPAPLTRLLRRTDQPFTCRGCIKKPSSKNIKRITIDLKNKLKKHCPKCQSSCEKCVKIFRRIESNTINSKSLQSKKRKLSFQKRQLSALLNDYVD